jgi:16S rRNA processing protein RimM
MIKDEFFYFGKILKTYGNQGHVLVYMDVDDPLKYRSLEWVYVEVNQEMIPFFIGSLELKPSQKGVIRFLDVNSVAEAEPFAGLRLFLPSSALPKLRGNKFYHHEVIGFTVIDEMHGNIGTVDSVLDLPVQPLFRIILEGKEILVPVVDAVIKKVDRKKKTLFISAPEGLIDLYL